MTSDEKLKYCIESWVETFDALNAVKKLLIG